MVDIVGRGMADVASARGLHVVQEVGARLPLTARYAVLGLIERNHREVLQLSAGDAYAKAEQMLPELCHEATEYVLLYAEASVRTLVGFSAAREVEEETLLVRYLLELQIDPDHRRKGLGRALVQDARRAAEAAGACGLMLTCNTRNSRALRFYATLGFVTSPTSPSLCAPASCAASSDDGNRYEILALIWGEGAFARLAARGIEALQHHNARVDERSAEKRALLSIAADDDDVFEEPPAKERRHTHSPLRKEDESVHELD
jgi:GNAT superfamily N-acetyltransferase